MIRVYSIDMSQKVSIELKECTYKLHARNYKNYNLSSFDGFPDSYCEFPSSSWVWWNSLAGDNNLSTIKTIISRAERKEAEKLENKNSSGEYGDIPAFEHWITTLSYWSPVNQKSINVLEFEVTDKIHMTVFDKGGQHKTRVHFTVSQFKEFCKLFY